jgi:hypothetical protein
VQKTLGSLTEFFVAKKIKSMINHKNNLLLPKKINDQSENPSPRCLLVKICRIEFVVCLSH